PWLGTLVGQNPAWIDHAGDGITKLRLFIANAVTTDHGDSGLNHLGQSAGKNPLQNFQISLLGKADHGEGSKWTSAHGVDIAERVGGGDLAEDVRVVYDRREEIHGLHEGLVGSDLIHSGVVGVIEADQDIGVMLPG